jgi:hypothetical protein
MQVIWGRLLLLRAIFMNRTLYLLISLFFLVTVLVACATRNDSPTTSLDGTYPLDPVFDSLYQELGGITHFGPAISPSVKQGDMIYQYTIAALFQHDRRSGVTSLAPVGKELGFQSVPDESSAVPGDRVINGVRIFPPFVGLFEKLGGVSVVGNPLSEVRYDERLGRYEQYFENLGFYQLVNDPTQKVYLLAYGAWMCQQSCSYPIPQNSRMDIPITKAEPFVEFVSHYGIEFSGYALTEPYIAPDGLIEQVYENMVLVLNPEHPEQVNLRSVPGLIGIETEPVEKADGDEQHRFVAVDGKKGYNVPKRFMDYLEKHGGVSIAGMPITRIQNIDQRLQKQCFERLCLEDVIDLNGDQIVRPSKLGYSYRKMYSGEQAEAGKVFKGSQLTIRPWENHPIIPPDQRQEIGANIYSGNEPLQGITAELILTYPNGDEKVYEMPPTNAEGKTQMTLQPIPGENGTLVSYRICVRDLQGERFCVKDSFLLWKENELRAHVNYLPVIFSWFEKTSHQIFLPLIFHK